MYIRNLRKPSPNKNVFKFASAKVNDVIMCESSIEFDACFHHEYDNDVTSFASQPKGFKYRFKGKNLPYTPDALIIYKDSSERFHEYKPYSQTSCPIFREKFAAKRTASIELLGIDLILVTDRQIRVNPILNNLKLLHRYSGVYGVSYVQKELLNLIKHSGFIKLNDICELYGLPLGETRASLYALLHKGLLKTDLGREDLNKNPTFWAVS